MENNVYYYKNINREITSKISYYNVNQVEYKTVDNVIRGNV